MSNIILRSTLLARAAELLSDYADILKSCANEKDREVEKLIYDATEISSIFNGVVLHRQSRRW